ncbi:MULTISPECIES: DUF6173 family protein [Gemmobacter]|jgi:hypothetical protein|uniref:Uncharacterized protein n=2 Tax=Gemmobacter TaxID=204456 RepID=A0A2T6B5B8_9RHOB|nr:MULTISPECIES: DUF6173 family protein [Gemmobacter]OJY31798.1 MAG: hypothetical protein BGP11_09455 [Rhodobacterales bacterium 65-51]PTX51222.1 hypothetical protein C8N34_104342 [Gemmobacter caeni]TWJ01222.1 hypothetical protein IQ03_01939 [Gemmobacter caeni]
MIDEIATSAEVLEASALPCAHVVHADPDAPETAEQQPLPAAVARKPVEQKSPAEWAYERLILYIRNFESQLDARHEVAMGFAGGEVGVLRIEGLGYFDPDLITFYGRDEDGAKMQLVQHVSQLNVALRAIPREMPDAPPRRIGFRLAQDWDEPAPAEPQHPAPEA